MLSRLAIVTGVRQTTCPWQAMRDPFVGAVLYAHRWYKEQQLFARLPRCPEALVRGLEVYDGALNAVQAHDIRAERDRIDQANEQRFHEFEGGPRMRPPASPRQPPVRRPRPPKPPK